MRGEGQGLTRGRRRGVPGRGSSLPAAAGTPTGRRPRRDGAGEVHGDGQVVGRGEAADDRPCAHDLRGPFVRQGQVPGEDVGRHVVDVDETAVGERPVGQVGAADAQFERLVRVGGGDAARGVPRRLLVAVRGEQGTLPVLQGADQLRVGALPHPGPDPERVAGPDEDVEEHGDAEDGLVRGGHVRVEDEEQRGRHAVGHGGQCLRPALRAHRRVDHQGQCPDAEGQDGDQCPQRGEQRPGQVLPPAQGTEVGHGAPPCRSARCSHQGRDGRTGGRGCGYPGARGGRRRYVRDMNVIGTRTSATARATSSPVAAA